MHILIIAIVIISSKGKQYFKKEVYDFQKDYISRIGLLDKFKYIHIDFQTNKISYMFFNNTLYNVTEKDKYQYYKKLTCIDHLRYERKSYINFTNMGLSAKWYIISEGIQNEIHFEYKTIQLDTDTNIKIPIGAHAKYILIDMDLYILKVRDPRRIEKMYSCSVFTHYGQINGPIFNIRINSLKTDKSIFKTKNTPIKHIKMTTENYNISLNAPNKIKCGDRISTEVIKIGWIIGFKYNVDNTSLYYSYKRFNGIVYDIHHVATDYSDAYLHLTHIYIDNEGSLLLQNPNRLWTHNYNINFDKNIKIPNEKLQDFYSKYANLKNKDIFYHLYATCYSYVPIRENLEKVTKDNILNFIDIGFMYKLIFNNDSYTTFEDKIYTEYEDMYIDFGDTLFLPCESRSINLKYSFEREIPKTFQVLIDINSEKTFFGSHSLNIINDLNFNFKLDYKYTIENVSDPEHTLTADIVNLELLYLISLSKLERYSYKAVNYKKNEHYPMLGYCTFFSDTYRLFYGRDGAMHMIHARDFEINMWYKPFHRINKACIATQQISLGGNAIINANFWHNGVYKCISEKGLLRQVNVHVIGILNWNMNNWAYGVGNQPFDLDLVKKILKMQYHKIYNVRIGKGLSIDCNKGDSIIFGGKLIYKWFLNGETILQNSSINIFKNKLQIQNFAYTHEGIYRCDVDITSFYKKHLKYKHAKSLYMQVTMTDSLEIIVKPLSQKVEHNSVIEILCAAKDDLSSIMKVKWYFSYMSLFGSTKKVKISEDLYKIDKQMNDRTIQIETILTIANIDDSRIGIYYCEFSNNETTKEEHAVIKYSSIFRATNSKIMYGILLIGIALPLIGFIMSLCSLSTDHYNRNKDVCNEEIAADEQINHSIIDENQETNA